MTRTTISKKIGIYLAFLEVGKEQTIENLPKLPSLENIFTHKDVLFWLASMAFLRNLKCYDSEN